jgi:uncharacterized membrane protein YeaQ/YmgE (transglycosylase-associated protein family)
MTKVECGWEDKRSTSSQPGFLSRQRLQLAGGVFLMYFLEIKMNFIIWIVVGGLLGWVASMIMRTDAQQGMFLNIVVGIIGALLGGWLLAPLFGTGTINQNDFSISSLLVSLLGAVILLAIVNLFRRGSPR